MTPQVDHISESISLSCIHTNKFKTGVLTLTFCIPLTKDNMIYNMLLSGVLRRGTERFPSMAAINRRLDELYAACVEIRSHHVGKNLLFTVSTEILDEKYAIEGESILEGVVEVLADLLLHPMMIDGHFSDPFVQQEIQFAQDSLRAEINNTRLYSAVRCMELMYRDDPCYPTIQEMQDRLPLITSRSLTDYYHTVLKRAPMEAFYVGSLSPEIPKAYLQKYFSAWNANPQRTLALPFADPSADAISVTEAMPISQGKLSMGFRTGVCANGKDQAVYTAMVFNEIFGGSPVSKLFMNVREKMSLCYYCSSSYNRYTGTLTVSAGIETKNRSVAEAAIRRQLESIQAGEISQSEFLAAKSALENAYRQIDDNPFELQSFYGNRALFGLGGDIEECRRMMAAVTVEEVVALSKNIFCDTVFFIEGTKKESCGEEENDE